MEKNLWSTLGALKYIGTGTSHFQSEPFMGGFLPTSDWENELKRNLNGESSAIKLPQRQEEFPRLLARKNFYAGRSAELGLNMFRFSIDLARLNPRKGEFNTELMAEYVRLLAYLRAWGQEPLVTMHHFTMPLRMVKFDREGRPQRGAWQHPDVVKYFRFCVGKVVAFLSDTDALRNALDGHFDQSVVDQIIAEGAVKYFMPFNEPATTLGNSYLGGVFPPFKRGRIDLAIHTLRKMAEVYAVMEDLLRQLGRNVPAHRAPLIGNCYNWQYFDGVGSSLLHTVVNEWQTRYLEKTVPRSDWMGLDYYCRTASLPGAKNQENKEYGDFPVFGDIYPLGITDLLKKMHAAYPSKAIFVSEIGFSDHEDRRRPYWLLETVRCILEAQQSGVPIAGMLYWSMVDNFEWECGMSQKFGLFSEAELMEPLTTSESRVRSWQVWQAVAECVRLPSEAAFTRLLELERKATQQHRKRFI